MWLLVAFIVIVILFLCWGPLRGPEEFRGGRGGGRGRGGGGRGRGGRGRGGRGRGGRGRGRGRGRWWRRGRGLWPVGYPRWGYYSWPYYGGGCYDVSPIEACAPGYYRTYDALGNDICC